MAIRASRAQIFYGKRADARAAEAAHFVHEYYKDSPEEVPLPRMELMILAQKRNPYSLAYVFDKQTKQIDCVTELWALNENRLDTLVRGAITEAELSDKDFLEHSPSINALYVAITKAGKPTGLNDQYAHLFLAGLHAMIWAFQEGYFQNPKKCLSLYGYNSTSDGRRMMHHLGFEPYCERPDDSGGYRLDLTAAKLKEIRAQWNIPPSEVGL